MKKDNSIVVSIFMLTYNQENFIAQTIESILMQKTNFNFQLVIGEDCSVDKTRIICKTYAKNNPDKIKLLPKLSNNIGLINNYIRTIKACNGKYIAICDGDDYWIDELKLQKQIDFLEQNKEFDIVYSNCIKLNEKGNQTKGLVINNVKNIDFDTLIFNNCIPSPTVVFKNIQQLKQFPVWIKDLPYGDWPTYLWVLNNGGKIYGLVDYTAVYRTSIGVSSKIRSRLSNLLLVEIKILKYILNDKMFENRINVVKKSLAQKQFNLMLAYNREKKYLKSFRVFKIGRAHV